MSKMFKEPFFRFLLTLIPGILFSSWLIRYLYPIQFVPQSLFFSQIIGSSAYIPIFLIYILGFLDLVLIWIIGRMLFKNNIAYLPVLIFGISPWFIYSVISGSFYVYLLSLILVNTISLFLIKLNNKKLSKVLFLISTILILYSSFLMFFVYPLLIIGFFLLNKEIFDKAKSYLIFSCILLLPMLFFIFKNPLSIQNLYHTQVSVLSDPGHINTVNMFRGESAEKGFRYISKFFENKYLYLSKYLILKSLKSLSPVIFFTPNEKLLGFSFSPPIYIGFIVPFLYGLISIVKSSKHRKYLFLSFLLVLPSIFSQQAVDLNRLLIFAPVVLFIISFGFNNINYKKHKPLFIVLVSLILIQFLVTISDISLREYPRFQNIYGSYNLQVGKQ